MGHRGVDAALGPRVAAGEARGHGVAQRGVDRGLAFPLRCGDEAVEHREVPLLGSERRYGVALSAVGGGAAGGLTGCAPGGTQMASVVPVGASSGEYFATTLSSTMRTQRSPP